MLPFRCCILIVLYIVSWCCLWWKSHARKQPYYVNWSITNSCNKYLDGLSIITRNYTSLWIARSHTVSRDILRTIYWWFNGKYIRIWVRIWWVEFHSIFFSSKHPRETYKQKNRLDKKNVEKCMAVKQNFKSGWARATWKREKTHLNNLRTDPTKFCREKTTKLKIEAKQGKEKCEQCLFSLSNACVGDMCSRGMECFFSPPPSSMSCNILQLWSK